MADLASARAARVSRLQAREGTVRSFVVPGIQTGVKISEKAGLALGSVTWDGAVVLSEYLASPKEALKGKGELVCELGAGTGLSGTTAALCGCQVLLTDKAGEVTSIMRETVELNGDSIAAAGGHADVLELSWGDAEATTRAVDWASMRGSTGVFDIILGADIVFKTDLVEALLETIEGLVPPGSKTRVLLAYRERGAGDIFFRGAIERGFALSVTAASSGSPPCQTSLEAVLRDAENAAAAPGYASFDFHVVVEMRRGQSRVPLRCRPSALKGPAD